jgi:hypothetical protein
MTDLEAVNTIAQTAASDASRALKELAELRAWTHAAFNVVFTVQVELLSAVEWLRRDGADQDDCAQARPHVERARELVDGVMAEAEAMARNTKVPT